MTRVIEEEAEVVEFGDEEPRSRRAMLTGALTGVRRDRRLVPVVAGLGAVALFASLAGEWQVTTVNQTNFAEPSVTGQEMPAGVGELGGWAGGYVIGVFALAGCVGLALFGRPAARDHARILGLTTAGVLLGVLIAIMMYLDGSSLILGPSYYNTDIRYEVAYGRGLTMAFLGVLLLGSALILAGRLLPAARATTPGGQAATDDDPDGDDPDGGTEPAERTDWLWRRPRQARETDDPEADLPPPADLTVTPTAPFVPLPDGKTDSSGR